MISQSLFRSAQRLMSSAYIVPLDVRAPSPRTVPNLDPQKLWSTIPVGEKPHKVGTTRIFYDTPPSSEGSNITAISALGEAFSTKVGDPRRELIRKAVGSAVKDVKSLGDGVKDVTIDTSLDPHASGKIDQSCSYILAVCLSCASCCGFSGAV